MFNYPEKTNTNKQLTLKELFKVYNFDKELKVNAASIDSICLSHVLSKHTTGLSESENVKEIYVIDIVLKENIVPTKFLTAFNKNIGLQTLFRVYYKDNVKYITSIKTFEDEKINVLQNFESDWMQQLKNNFPNTTKLENVFKEIIKKVSCCKFKENESLNEFSHRFNQIKKLKSEILKLTKQVNAEKQPNLKMELNDNLKQLKKELLNVEE